MGNSLNEIMITLITLIWTMEFHFYAIVVFEYSFDVVQILDLNVLCPHYLSSFYSKTSHI